MGVYIPNMEMPKSCYGCLFFTQVDYWNKNDEADILSKCKRTGEFTWESVNGYLPNCPLVPVPAHGRLIDGDVAEAICFTDEDADSGKDFIDGILYAADFISKQPTIIPADPAEEGET